MLTWTGKLWEKVVDVPKPPLWEIDTDGAPLSFQTFIPEDIIPEPVKHVQLDEAAAEAFRDEAGMQKEHLIALSAAATICSLLVLGVCMPMTMGPRCMRILRRNAPEIRDERRTEQLDLQLEAALMIENLEDALKEREVITDEWGIKHKVTTSHQLVLVKKLQKQRKRQVALEAKATANKAARDAKDQRNTQRKQEHLERLQRMRDAYKVKTIAIDGIALRAPPAVLEEIGFDPDMIEAFGLPGFDDIDEHDERNQKNEAMEAIEEKKGDAEEGMSELGNLQDDGDEDEEESDHGGEADNDPLQIPPRLNEIMGSVMKEGAKHRKRRGAMPGFEEGQPMAKDVIQTAARIASSLHIADLLEEDEVDRWLQLASQREHHNDLSHVDLIDFPSLTFDEDHITKELARLVEKFDLRRTASLFAGEEVENLGLEKADELSDASQEFQEWKDEQAGAAHLDELMDVFGKGHTSMLMKGQAEAGDDGAKGGEPEAAGLAAALARARNARDDWSDKSSEKDQEQGPQPYQGKVYGGMAVRPRGLGTPRKQRLPGEVFRAAMQGDAGKHGDGYQWGKFVHQKQHWKEPEKHDKEGGALLEDGKRKKPKKKSKTEQSSPDKK